MAEGSSNLNDSAVAEDKFPLADVPADVLKTNPNSVYPNIGEYLSPLERKYLAEIGNKHLLFSYKADIKPANRLIHQFLTHVVRGEKAQVEEMIKRDSRLLLEKIKVTDEAGRTIYGTAYQIALGAKDVSPYPDQFEEMAEMIERYLLQLPNGEEERNKQYNEQFPEGFEKKEEARRKQDSLALKKVFTAIKNDNSTDLTNAKEAVKEFIAYLEAQKKDVITTGYHFNEAIFDEVLKLYDENYDNFGGYDSPKNRLAAINVIGQIQKQLFTACLAQAMCDGIGNVVDNKKQLSRKKLLDDNKTSFFDPSLGVSHFVYSFYEGRGWARAGHGRAGAGGSKLMSRKNSNIVKRQHIVSKREPKKASSICLIQ